jgi:hypothetical protein
MISERIWACWQALTTTRYTRRLEAEVDLERAEIERLRQENRALLNSLLGTAGVPPIETPAAHQPTIAPVRRRSWPQIATVREIEAARQARSHQHQETGNAQ